MYTYDKIALPNGLRVLFLHMPHVHSTVCAAYVAVGSRHERPETAGLSHLLEHMLFRGARGYADSVELLAAVEDIGGTADAYTSPEYIAFLMRCHARNAAKLVSVFADLLLGGEFRAEDLELERSIVLEEITEYRSPAGDYLTIDDMAYNLMWRVEAKAGMSLGNERSIRSFTVDDLRQHYERSFVPPNMVLCVAGNFCRDEVEDTIRSAFSDLSGERPEVDAESADEQTEPRSSFVSVSASSVQVKLCHKAFSYRHPHLLAMLLTADVLGGGVSSRLMCGVREREGLVYEIACMPTLFADFGSVDVFTRTSRPNLVKTVQAVLGELDRLVQDGITERELHRTEESVFTQMHLVMDTPTDMANWFAVEELLIEPEQPETPEAQAERIRNVSLDEVAAVLREIFQPSRRSLVVVGPCGWRQKRRLRRMLAG